MKDIKLDNNVNVEFGNTSRDILLKIDLDNEIARAKAAEQGMIDDFAAFVQVELKDEVVPGAYEKRHLLYVSLLNKAQTIISSSYVDLDTEHVIKKAALDLITKELIFYSYNGEEYIEEFRCDISALIDDYNTKIENEAAARALVDGQLADRITFEENRAKNAEEALAANITQEINRAQAAEEVITTNLNNEIERAKERETSIEVALSTEKTERVAADATLQANINAETSSRIAADEVLQEQIDSEISTIASAIADLEDRKLDKVSPVDTCTVYGTTATGSQTNFEITQYFPTAGKIPMYTAGGNLRTATTTDDPTACVNVNYLDGRLSTKVSIVSEKARLVYGVTANGDQTTYQLTQNYPQSTQIPLYTTDKTLRTDTPSAGNDAANKNYVDTNINTVSVSLAEETSNRISADDVLQNNIDEEASLRSTGDTALSAEISAVNYSALHKKVDEDIDSVKTIINNKTFNFKDSEYHTYKIGATGNDSIAILRGDSTIANIGNSVISVNRDVKLNAMGTDVKSATTKEYVDSACASLQANISAEKSRAEGIESGLSNSIDQINEKIPTAATSSNQLADKEFVNSSIATNTAKFLATLDATTDLGLTKPASHADIITKLNEYSFIETKSNNDYCFVINEDSSSHAIYDRFKYVADTTTFKYEYSLNNSSFTATQWAAINSGITTTLTAKISTNETNIANEITRATASETALQTRIATEETTRASAIGSLQASLSELASIVDTKSVVAVASAGTSISKVNYITVNGTEYKLADSDAVTLEDSQTITGEKTIKNNLVFENTAVASNKAKIYVSNDETPVLWLKTFVPATGSARSILGLADTGITACRSIVPDKLSSTIDLGTSAIPFDNLYISNNVNTPLLTVGNTTLNETQLKKLLALLDTMEAE